MPIASPPLTMSSPIASHDSLTIPTHCPTSLLSHSNSHSFGTADASTQVPSSSPRSWMYCRWQNHQIQGIQTCENSLCQTRTLSRLLPQRKYRQPMPRPTHPSSAELLPRLLRILPHSGTNHLRHHRSIQYSQKLHPRRM